MPKRGRNSFKFQGEGVQNPDGTISTLLQPGQCRMCVRSSEQCSKMTILLT